MSEGDDAVVFPVYTPINPVPKDVRKIFKWMELRGLSVEDKVPVVRAGKIRIGNAVLTEQDVIAIKEFLSKKRS